MGGIDCNNRIQGKSMGKLAWIFELCGCAGRGRKRVRGQWRGMGEKEVVHGTQSGLGTWDVHGECEVHRERWRMQRQRCANCPTPWRGEDWGAGGWVSSALGNVTLVMKTERPRWYLRQSEKQKVRESWNGEVAGSESGDKRCCGQE